MKEALIFSGSSPIVILTNHKGFEDSGLLDRLRHKGISLRQSYIDSERRFSH